MMKIGVFFGGQSREREVSFAGGRTVYDNLNKSMFEALPIFVDGLGRFILLDWAYVYKGTIRDFYPPTAFVPAEEKHFQLYIESLQTSNQQLDSIAQSVGRQVFPHEFAQLFDVAFLALHGPYGEDGNIQGLLEWYGVPYTGCGILPSSIGINKLVQKDLMTKAGFQTPKFRVLSRSEWMGIQNPEDLLDQYIQQIGLPFVVKAPNQGSSIGVSIQHEKNVDQFVRNIQKSFFIQVVHLDQWKSLSDQEKYEFVRDLADIRSGIGLPVLSGQKTIFSPQALIDFLESQFQNGEQEVCLENPEGEEQILIEGFIEGKEFSCIVIQDEAGKPIALPPTEILKAGNLFDYRSKYLPGMSRKITPIELPVAEIEAICTACASLFDALHCQVYARIDGFYTNDKQIYLNDPNTTSGMMPSSFFFHQAAEIGLNPSQFLTYIIRTSLIERIKLGKQLSKTKSLLQKLDFEMHALKTQNNQKKKVAVIMGGYSTERHISVESGRNVYEKLSSSVQYDPTPVFLTGNDAAYALYKMPINIMLKDNADDIKEKIVSPGPKHPIIKKIVEQTESIRALYTNGEGLELSLLPIESLRDTFDEVFIALHGRPGEDGNLQEKLTKLGIPFNGSLASSAAITINKYETNRRLRAAGFLVSNHRLVDSSEWSRDPDLLIDEIEQNFHYPFIAKPHDDGCSSAVKKIKNRKELAAFAAMMFRTTEAFLEEPASILHLKLKEEFPQKSSFLIEDLITAQGAERFLEITGGMLTFYDQQGNLQYELFEPSEALANGEVLSLEEKFLAGEGQNITPARYSKDQKEQARISKEVKETLGAVAKTLDVQGYCRIDAFVRIFADGKVETIIIEINSLPGMTPATCIFHQCALNGYKPYEFIDALLQFGQSRNEKMAVL